MGWQDRNFSTASENSYLVIERPLRGLLDGSKSYQKDFRTPMRDDRSDYRREISGEDSEENETTTTILRGCFLYGFIYNLLGYIL